MAQFDTQVRKIPSHASGLIPSLQHCLEEKRVFCEVVEKFERFGSGGREVDSQVNNRGGVIRDFRG
ncbi:hypothetical protein IGI04_018156 [Brassica rapa subsp. trilocularis]|uniref:Uncharacterized protein n=1 Tax=Brassica rapa subsp. trilocularis TaxID=1813537 RepID=A0ABQ7MCJ6_BRACM|nr:hypothetical protein IGI04_018156 [Brassica rapa subsp. trilocularis]